tara:strand:- start:68 stop:391 length:324 start_codon:yes stop_codon:yes gene_type:complete
MKDIFLELNKTIDLRKHESPQSSYTAFLLDKGIEKCAQKFGEEAIEVIIAANSRNDKNFKTEVADLLYHLLVLLKIKDTPLEDVLKVLSERKGISGHEEKKSRPTDL